MNVELIRDQWEANWQAAQAQRQRESALVRRIEILEAQVAQLAPLAAEWERWLNAPVKIGER